VADGATIATCGVRATRTLDAARAPTCMLARETPSAFLAAAASRPLTRCSESSHASTPPRRRWIAGGGTRSASCSDELGDGGVHSGGSATASLDDGALAVTTAAVTAAAVTADEDAVGTTGEAAVAATVVTTGRLGEPEGDPDCSCNDSNRA
jgi:hypothetical protein